MTRLTRTARSTAIFVALAAVSGCSTGPRPTAEAIRRESNARATVEGVVHDEGRRPVAGIEVIGLPRDRDVSWSPRVSTDTEGRFRLVLVAPGDYGFLLSWKGVVVATEKPEDPSRLRIRLVPGEARGGLELTWLRAEWEATLRASGQAVPAAD